MPAYRKTLVLLCAATFALFSAAVLRSHATAPVAGASGYRLTKTIPIAGDGGWDYVTVDSAARRVYVSRGTHVVVLDADTYEVVGDISRYTGRTRYRARPGVRPRIHEQRAR